MTRDTPILLTGAKGEPHGRLRLGVLALVAEAEQHAREEHLAKATAVSATLRSYVESAGLRISAESLKEACQLINQVRMGASVASITVIVHNPAAAPAAAASRRHSQGGGPRREPPSMTNLSSGPFAINFFEAERTFPDDDAHAWYESLQGLEQQKEKLLLELELLLYPERLQRWSERHHRGLLKICERIHHRVPLILFEGDVGTGKTALAETVGDALARRIKARRVHLLKINTQVRGTGQVGEMSDLIVQAFTQAEQRARSLKGEPVLLLLDESDALAASRSMQQMHHEDKAGLNTLIQRLDNLRPTRLPIAALFVTNRADALDAAVRRRAALTLHFERPDDAVRAEILRASVPELRLSETQLSQLVRRTGPTEKNGAVPFTASDLTDRLLPAALRAAYSADRPLQADDLLEQAEVLHATPPFGRQSA